MTHPLIRICLPLFLTTLLIPCAMAQDPGSTLPPDTTSRGTGIIAGHEFISTSFIEQPFIRTYLRTGLGFGITPELHVPLITFNGQTFYGSEGSLLFGVLNVEYQQTIRDWLAIRGRLNVLGRMADGAQAIVAQGVTLFSGFELGWRFRLAETERFSMSGEVGLKNSAATDVYLQRFIDGIIENGEVLPGNEVVQTTPTLLGTFSAQGAYGINDLVGLSASVAFDYGESIDRNVGEKWYYSVTAAADFNLNHNGGPPVGFVLGGRTGLNPQTAGVGDGTIQTLFGRIAYTGGRDYELGLDFAAEFMPVRGLEKKQTFLSAIVDIKLYL